MTSTRKAFLQEQLPELLNKLEANSPPSFGIMTAQHMVEHLAWIIKTTIKNYGEAPQEPTKGQLKFKQFIANGAVFKHFPKEDAEVGKLKYTSLEEALEQIPIAVGRFYDFFEANPNHVPFNPMMGSLSFEELELFHYQHCRYHLWQFELINEYS